MEGWNLSRIRYIEPAVMLATLVRWFFLATVTGAIVGTASSLFLHILFSSIDKTSHISLWLKMTLLPLGGFFNGLILYYGYKNAPNDKKDSVIAAIHFQSGKMPVKTFLIKPIAAIITLASGGSAGRQGPCSHIGGTIASLFGRLLRLNPEMQKRIVACGVSAGFSAVFGTPIAGAIYGIEVLAIGRIRHDFLFPAVVAGVTSFEVTHFFGKVTYEYYPLKHLPHFSEILLIKIVVIGIICGLISWIFIELIHEIRLLFNFIRLRFRLWPPLVPFIGGLILALLLFILPTDYLGLSIPLMNHALGGEKMPYLGFLWKSLFVAITLGSGFYGGIVTPQFVIGAVAGNAFATVLGINPALGAAIGLVAVLAAASNTPISAIFMGFELFGGPSGIFIVAACITAYLVIGHRSVYPEQLVAFSKSSWMHLIPEVALENEKIHISYGLLRRIRRFRHGHHHFRPPRKK